jgi:uncharacterized protein YjfI (DUF2170 family)
MVQAKEHYYIILGNFGLKTLLKDITGIRKNVDNEIVTMEEFEEALKNKNGT